MSAFISWLLGGLWPKFALAAAAVVIILGVVLRLFNAGKAAEKLAQAERNANARKTRVEVEREIRETAADPDGASAADRLRDRWSRD